MDLPQDLGAARSRPSVPDTFFFANNVSVAAEIDVDVTWRAMADPVVRGKGTEVPPDDRWCQTP